MDIVSLGSGSKGNSTYVYVNGVHILIDVGLSMKQINERMLESTKYFNLSDIDLILITHTHKDHILSLDAIYRNYPKAIIIIPKEVYEEYMIKTKKFINNNRLVVIDKELNGEFVKIKSFDLNHDVACYGYEIIDKRNNENFIFFADNGGIPYSRWDNFIGATYYAIESNHDLTMQILDEKRNELLKRRVLGFYGHTHNEYAFSFAKHVVTSNTRGILFNHLSEDCNSIELAYRTHDTLMSIWGFREKFKHIKVLYAEQRTPVTLNMEE